VRPPGAVSPIRGKVYGVEIPLVAKSRSPNSNALAQAYAEHALLTQEG